MNKTEKAEAFISFLDHEPTICYGDDDLAYVEWDRGGFGYLATFADGDDDDQIYIHKH